MVNRSIYVVCLIDGDVPEHLLSVLTVSAHYTREAAENCCSEGCCVREYVPIDMTQNQDWDIRDELEED